MATKKPVVLKGSRCKKEYIGSACVVKLKTPGLYRWHPTSMCKKSGGGFKTTGTPRIAYFKTSCVCRKGGKKYIKTGGSCK